MPTQLGRRLFSLRRSRNRSGNVICAPTLPRPLPKREGSQMHHVLIAAGLRLRSPLSSGTSCTISSTSSLTRTFSAWPS